MDHVVNEIEHDLIEREICVLDVLRIEAFREQRNRKLSLVVQERSSIASDEPRRGRSCLRWNASGTEKV